MHFLHSQQTLLPGQAKTLSARRHGPKNTSDSTRPAPRRRDSGDKVKGKMLARVVIQNSSKPSQIAMVKPGGRKPHSRDVSTSSSSSSSSATLSNKKKSSSSATLVPTSNHTINGSQSLSQLNLQYPPSIPAAVTQTRSTKQQPRHKFSEQDILEPTEPTAAATPSKNRTRQQPSRAAQSTPTLVKTTPSRPPLPRIDSAVALSTATLSPPHNPPQSPQSPPISSPPPQYEQYQEHSPPPELPLRRRKATPTFYSIASNRTKLGEIPVEQWPEQWDSAQMEALNREAVAQGWPILLNGQDGDIGFEGGRRRRGRLWRLFHR